MKGQAVDNYRDGRGDRAYYPIIRTSSKGHTRSTGTKASGSDSADAEFEDRVCVQRQVPREPAEQIRQGWRPRLGSSVSGSGK